MATYRLTPKDDYNVEWVLQLERNRGPLRIQTRWTNDGLRFLIRANSAGLLYLARDLITLAATVWSRGHPGAPEVDYEPKSDLEPGVEFGLLDKGSVPLLISLMKKPAPIPFVTFETQISTGSGEVKIEWRRGARLKTFLETDTFAILANQPALLSIVVHLVQLADESLPLGSGFDYDGPPLERGSMSIRIEKPRL